MTTEQIPTSSADMLEIFEVKPGKPFAVSTLRAWLPDTETILFFAKVYDLDAAQVGRLLHKVLNTTLTSALFDEGGLHSIDLQDYLVGYKDEYGNWVPGIIDDPNFGDENFSADLPDSEVLVQFWEGLEVTIAESIKDVAAKLEGVVGLMPGKQGSMVFQSMMKLNKNRPTLGISESVIQHGRQRENLLILDVSGSMTESTVETIISDVVALSYTMNAHLAIVSDGCTYWTPGAYGVDEVLAAATYGGTHYETLTPLFDRDWGVVVCVADYDSSVDAKHRLASCVGRIDQVFDISLVHRPTYLAECVGQLADKVEPILIASQGAWLTW